METRIILAIDLGRYKSVLCWYDPDTRAAEFSTVSTTPEDIKRAIVRSPVSIVVFEACTQAGWVHDLCEATGLPTMVASTAGEAWQWKRVKRKTDRDDALKIARMAAINEIDPVAIPDRVTRQWKSLIGMRKRLVSGERTPPPWSPRSGRWRSGAGQPLRAMRRRARLTALASARERRSSWR
jgi:transposase